jgi:hypothetical protein
MGAGGALAGQADGAVSSIVGATDPQLKLPGSAAQRRGDQFTQRELAACADEGGVGLMIVKGGVRG